ncbi:LysR family transcriptional regulator [Jatrophihabitans sp.]|uniref:LysR family transcriptional regulator n=1 Tax=Jatrophihabitans sp. TaxID=1932789 RepID=UPI0030C7353C|nr:transcriptional regulator, LysR family [Jatrophihabitans sp.]
MDLKQLIALVTVAEVGSVTKAAQLLHVVQPAVTRQIRALERELGVELFERSRAGMIPTDAGLVLVERARRALAELDRARAQLRPETGHIRGVVRVGLLESVIDFLVEPLVAAMAERHPEVTLHIVTAYSGDLQRWLDAGDLDLSLLYDLSSGPSMAMIPLLEERLWAVAPLGEGLSPERPVSLVEVLGHPLVLPISGHGLRAIFDRARAGVTPHPRIAVETNSISVQKQLVLGGYGWSVLPAAGVAADVAAGRLSGAPVTAPEMTRAVVLGIQRGHASPAVDAVSRQLSEQVWRLVSSGRWPALPSPSAAAAPTDQ